MPEWIWAAAVAASIAVTVPLALRARREEAPHATVALLFLVLGYLLLAILFAADVIARHWSDPTLRFTRGCVAGLGVGAIIGAIILLVARPRRSR
jgi:hypothetical protein